MSREDEKPSGGTLGHVFDALRALVSATSIIGASSIFYLWAAPWIVWIVDRWREISDVLFGWLPIETTPEGRLLASVLLLFSILGPMKSAAQYLFEIRRVWSHSTWRDDFLRYSSAIILIILLPAMSLDYLDGRRVFEEREFLKGDYFWVNLASTVYFYIVSLFISRRYTTYFTIWVAAFFALDQLYRYDVLWFLRGPPT